MCPEIRGIIKNINEDLWAHVTCINWTQEIFYEDVE